MVCDQSSYMIWDYGGGVCEQQKNWCGPDCTCRVDDGSDTYCSDCFESIEEHKQAVLDNEEELEEDGIIPTD